MLNFCRENDARVKKAYCKHTKNRSATFARLFQTKPLIKCLKNWVDNMKKPSYINPFTFVQTSSEAVSPPVNQLIQRFLLNQVHSSVKMSRPFAILCLGAAVATYTVAVS